jgi:hypothetical protein
LVAIVSDVAGQFGFVRIDPLDLDAHFQRDYPHIDLAVRITTRDGYHKVLEISIWDKWHPNESGISAKLRSALQPRLESEFPGYTLRFEESKQGFPRDL